MEALGQPKNVDITMGKGERKDKSRFIVYLFLPVLTGIVLIST